MPDQERLDKALKGAAEQVEEGCVWQDCTLHAGWAEAIRALAGTSCSVGWFDPAGHCPSRTDDPDGWCPRCTAIDKFIKAMLGGDDA